MSNTTHLECEIAAERVAGDHWITVGRVDDPHLPPAGDPLAVVGGAFHTTIDTGRPQ